MSPHHTEKRAEDLRVGDTIYMNGHRYPVLGVHVIRCHGREHGYMYPSWVSVCIERIDGQTASYFFQANEFVEVGESNVADDATD